MRQVARFLVPSMLLVLPACLPTDENGRLSWAGGGSSGGGSGPRVDGPTTPGTLSIAGPVLFGSRVVGTTTALTITVSNGSATNATFMMSLLSGVFTFTGVSYPGVGGDCGESLASGASCTLEVAFAPTAPGNAQSTLTLSYFDGVSIQAATATLAGTGVSAASVTISDGPLFQYSKGIVNVSQEHKVFTLTNGGEHVATNFAVPSVGGLTGRFLWKGGTFPGTGGTCSLATQLAQNDSCSVVVTFSPTATSPVSDTVNVQYDNGAGSATASVAVQGSAATPASLSISGTADFGTVTIGVLTAPARTFTVTNSGGTAATNLHASPSSPLSNGFTWANGTFPGANGGGYCGTSLAAGGSCSIVVTFQPTLEGAVDSDIVLDYTNGTSPASLEITGTGQEPASLTISDGPTYSFPDGIANGAAREKTFTVTNDGGAKANNVQIGSLVPEPPFAWKGGAFPGTGGDCGTVITELSATASCTLVVTMASVTATAPSTGQISVKYSDGTGGSLVTAQRNISGTVKTGAAVAATGATPGDFGSKATGFTYDLEIDFMNSGGTQALNLGTAVAPPSPFRYGNGGAYPGTTAPGACGSSLAAGSSCKVGIQFVAADPGSVTKVFKLQYEGTAADPTPALAPVSLTANGLGPIELALDPPLIPSSNTVTLAYGSLLKITASGGNGTYGFSSSGTGGALDGVQPNYRIFETVPGWTSSQDTTITVTSPGSTAKTLIIRTPQSRSIDTTFGTTGFVPAPLCSDCVTTPKAVIYDNVLGQIVVASSKITSLPFGDGAYFYPKFQVSSYTKTGAFGNSSEFVAIEQAGFSVGAAQQTDTPISVAAQQISSNRYYVVTGTVGGGTDTVVCRLNAVSLSLDSTFNAGNPCIRYSTIAATSAATHDDMHGFVRQGTSSGWSLNTFQSAPLTTLEGPAFLGPALTPHIVPVNNLTGGAMIMARDEGASSTMHFTRVRFTSSGAELDSTFNPLNVSAPSDVFVTQTQISKALPTAAGGYADYAYQVFGGPDRVAVSGAGDVGGGLVYLYTVDPSAAIQGGQRAIAGGTGFRSNAVLVQSGKSVLVAGHATVTVTGKVRTWIAKFRDASTFYDPAVSGFTTTLNVFATWTDVGWNAYFGGQAAEADAITALAQLPDGRVIAVGYRSPLPTEAVPMIFSFWP